MRALPTLALVALFTPAACNSGEARWGGDTWVAPDSDTDTDTDTDSDTDTDTDTDSDTDTDTDTGTPSAECHPYDPVDKPGLRRSYAVNYKGQTGTETQIVESEGLLPNGQFAFFVRNELTAGNEAWSGPVYYSCDRNGAISLVGWNMALRTSFSGFPLDVGPVEALHTPGRRNLPPVAQMGSSANNWDGTYNVEVVAEGTTSTFSTTGQFAEIGFQQTTVPAGTFETYVVSYRYVQDRSGVSAFSLPPELRDFFPELDIFGALGSFSEDIDAYAEYHYAEGIGLVYELTVDATTGAIIMEKSLTSYQPAR